MDGAIGRCSVPNFSVQRPDHCVQVGFGSRVKGHRTILHAGCDIQDADRHQGRAGRS